MASFHLHLVLLLSVSVIMSSAQLLRDSQRKHQVSDQNNDYDTNSHQNNNDSTKHHNDNAKEEFTAKQNDKKNGNIDLNQNEKNEKGINNNQKNDTKDGEFDGPYIYTDDSVSMIR